MSGIDYQQVAVNAAVDAAKRVRRTTDDIEQELADEAKADHVAAKSRGERIHTIARRVAWELHAKGRLGSFSHVELEMELVGVLAETLYPGVAVDL